MPDRPTFYRIVLRSHLGRSWAASLPVEEFANTQDAQGAPITCMTLHVGNQSKLIDMLLDLHTHGLVIESLRYVEHAVLLKSRDSTSPEAMRIDELR